MKCDLCIRLKETLHGSPGVKPTRDSASIKKATDELTLHRKVNIISTHAARVIFTLVCSDNNVSPAGGKYILSPCQQTVDRGRFHLGADHRKEYSKS